MAVWYPAPCAFFQYLVAFTPSHDLPRLQDVIYEKLPADIAQRHVLLMDPILSTGNSAATAMEVRFAI